MFKLFSSCVVALVIASATADACWATQTFAERVKASTAILYSQEEDGGMRMRCTATAFEKTETGYLFISAAHCIGEDDTAHEAVASYDTTRFFLTFDESAVKRFYAATVRMVGYQHRGDDLAVFEVTTTDRWPVTPVGSEKDESEGNPFINVASPLGLGLQVFHGSISKLELDRPIIQGDINWIGTLVLQITGVNGGSSGSAVVSEGQEKIVGILVGTIGGSTIIAIPATRFVKFRAQVEAGKYRWMKSDKDEQ